MAKTTATRDFVKQRQKLQLAGATKQLEKVSQAWMDSQINGQITLQRTSHGESRSDVEKWEAGGRYRLITQVVTTEPMHRIFLFVGSHAEADAWLDRQRNRTWVAKESDTTISQVEVSDTVHTPQLPLSTDTVDRKLFLGLHADQWGVLNISDTAQRELQELTTTDIDTGDLDGRILDIVDDVDAAICLLDIAKMLHQGQGSSIQARIDVYTGVARKLEGEELSSRLSRVGSTEELITFNEPEDLRALLELDNWEDWQLFLHPRQRELVNREFSGPARVRGISGSGKTSVAVHRARTLSERYRLPVVMVTLTRSARNILTSLKDSLCGKGSVSSRRIRTSTVAQVAKAFLSEFDSQWFDNRKSPSHDELTSAYSTAIDASNLATSLRAEAGLEGLRQKGAAEAYAREEIEYVRTAFTLADRNSYRLAKRAGRRLALNKRLRKLVLHAVDSTEYILNQSHFADHEMLILRALDKVTERIGWDDLLKLREFPFPLSRAVIVDESQDMTENELRLMAQLAPETEDNLFIVGDGAQKVYNRGFSFSRAGIDVKGRSTILRKNYRNTRQILEAAYPLVTQFVNETAEDSSAYLEGQPDYSEREGIRPSLLGFSDGSSEATWVAEKAKWYIENHAVTGSSIGVIAPTPNLRASLTEALSKVGIPSVDIKSALLSDEPEAVRVTTIESAKGHEFPIVFLCGFVEGNLPTFASIRTDDLWLEAARAYVAMTRARDWLHLTYAESYDNRPRKPSRFLDIIRERCDTGNNK